LCVAAAEEEVASGALAVMVEVSAETLGVVDVAEL